MLPETRASSFAFSRKVVRDDSFTRKTDDFFPISRSEETNGGSEEEQIAF